MYNSRTVTDYIAEVVLTEAMVPFYILLLFLQRETAIVTSCLLPWTMKLF